MIFMLLWLSCIKFVVVMVVSYALVRMVDNIINKYLSYLFLYVMLERSHGAKEENYPGYH